MQIASKDKLNELQTIISRMPLDLCCQMVVPEFSVRWREVSRVIRQTRQPMVAASVARVLTRHAGRSLTQDEVGHIVQRLKLKLIAIQERKWHIIDLLEPMGEFTVDQIIQDLPEMVAQAILHIKKGNIRPEVHTLVMNELLYISVGVASQRGAGPVLYVCTPPGAAVAAVSSPGSALLPAAVRGLGFRKHEDAKLHGKDIESLLRIHNKGWTANADYLDEIPVYNPVPTITSTGIDYTYKSYNMNYVDTILGPEPPLLTELTIESTKPFFDPTRLNQVMNVKIQIKSEDIAKTLKSWVNLGALHPTSELFTIFTKVKGNKLEMNDDDLE